MSIDISKIFGKSKQSDAASSAAAAPPRGRLWYVPDDFPDVQAALDGADAGDGVFLYPGNYDLAGPLLITKPVHLLGVDDVGASAVLRFRTSETYLPLLRIMCSNVRVKGVTLESIYTGGGGGMQQQRLDPTSPRCVAVSVANNAQNVVLDECAVRGMSGMHGLFLGAGSYTTLMCCAVSSATGCAVFSDGRLFADRCDFTMSAVGLMVSQNSTANVKASCFTGCNTGAVVDGYGHVDVQASVFSKCRVGVAVHADLPPPKVSVLRGSEFVDCGRSAVAVSGVESALDVQKCYFHGACDHAILVHNATQRVEIRANAFKNLTGTGVRVAAGCPVVECNVFDACSTSGVLVESCRPIIRLNEFVRNRYVPPPRGTGSGSSGAPAALPPPRGVAVRIDGTQVTNGTVHAAHAALFAEHCSSFSLTTVHSSTTADINQHPSASSPLICSEKANAVLADRSAIASATHAALHVMRPHPDPHVEGNLFAENQVNLSVTLGSGTYVKNELLSAMEESVCIDGGVPPAAATGRSDAGTDDGSLTAAATAAGWRLPEFPASISHNELRGSVTSHVVLLAPGAFATVTHNQITHAPKGFAVLIDDARFVEVKQNTLGQCQGGIQARGANAVGKVVLNDMQGLSLYVQSEAASSMYVAQNTNAFDPEAAKKKEGH